MKVRIASLKRGSTGNVLRIALASVMAFGLVETGQASLCQLSDVIITLDSDGIPMEATSCGDGNFTNDALNNNDPSSWSVNLDNAGGMNDWNAWMKAQVDGEGDLLEWSTPDPDTPAEEQEVANGLPINLSTLNGTGDEGAGEDPFSSGTFTLTAFDPMLIVLKDGAAAGTANYVWYMFEGKQGPASGTWTTDNVFNGRDLSHLTVYAKGTGVPPQLIPVPAAVWLFGSGLLGLVGVARRRKHQ